MQHRQKFVNVLLRDKNQIIDKFQMGILNVLKVEEYVSISIQRRPQLIKLVSPD
jgi:hypothetical protein